VKQSVPQKRSWDMFNGQSAAIKEEKKMRD